jgi:hypothetical protein
LVATANRFSNLPPELTRAGRFDARFFFGCPDYAGRLEIILAHLKARRCSFAEADLRPVVNATLGFTGAEIEQLILDSLYGAFGGGAQISVGDLVSYASVMKPLVKAVGSGLDEVWALIEQGRVQLASDNFLSRIELAKLIDPHLFSPMYCRKENIIGWEKQSTIGERLLMRNPKGGAAAAVMSTGDPEWVFVQTNIRYDIRDIHDFKFIERVRAIGSNGIFDTLVVDYAVDSFIMETQGLYDILSQDNILSAYVDMFSVADRPAAF